MTTISEAKDWIANEMDRIRGILAEKKVVTPPEPVSLADATLMAGLLMTEKYVRMLMHMAYGLGTLSEQT